MAISNSLISSTLPTVPTSPAIIPNSTLPTATEKLSAFTLRIITAPEPHEQLFTTSEGSDEGSLLREGGGVALNAVYIAMFILLGICILLCVVSSACWCFMKHRQDNRFNNFMNQPADQGRHEREEDT